MEDASTSSGMLDTMQFAGPLEAQLGYLIVVIAPALFWAMLVFAGAHLVGSASAVQFGVAVFVTSSAFLTFVTRALRIRV